MPRSSVGADRGRRARRSGGAGQRPVVGAAPTLEFERVLWAAGHDVVVGMDEVGRGAWAGPIMVGAAVLPKGRRVYGVRDSKMLTEQRREVLFSRIASWCSAWAVGSASQEECDSLGMAEAQRLASRRALEALGVAPSIVLLDGKWDFAGVAHVDKIVGGDRRCLSIAAASILAKVTRDRLMRSLAPNFPPYEFEHNKGYPCWRHKMALQAYGPSAIHRRTWVFMDELSWKMRAMRVGDGSGQAESLDASARGQVVAGAGWGAGAWLEEEPRSEGRGGPRDAGP